MPKQHFSHFDYTLPAMKCLSNTMKIQHAFQQQNETFITLISTVKLECNYFYFKTIILWNFGSSGRNKCCAWIVASLLFLAAEKKIPPQIVPVGRSNHLRHCASFLGSNLINIVTNDSCLSTTTNLTTRLLLNLWRQTQHYSIL